MIIYNGIDLSPYMKITDIRGRGLIQADFTEIVVPGRPGSYFVSKQKPKRILENDYKILAHTQTELRQKIDELNAILDVDEPVPIVYADEPDKTYYGIAYSDGQEQQILSLQKGTLVFVCFDPYKYGPTRSQTINVPPATFTRNSIAYLSDGTQVSANQPRFENGGVLIEDGTTNLLTANQASVETDLSGIVANYPSDVTITRDTTVAWHGNASAKVSCSVSTNYRGVRIGPISLTSGKTYTFSAYVRGLNGGEKVRLAVTNNGPWKSYTSDVTLTTNFQRLTLTWACDATGSYYLEIGQFGNSTPVTFYYDGGQVEEKPYASTFVDGTRQPETLTLPTDGVLNPQEGTIEVEFDYQNLNRWQRLVSFIGSTYPGNAINGYYDQHLDISPTGSVRFQIVRNGNTGEVKQIASAGGLSNGRHIVAANWGSDGISLYIDGVKVASNSYNEGFKQLDDTITIGRDNENNNGYLGGYVRNLRISRIARSDAEILDAYQNGFTVDEYTTAYLPFDGSLEVQTPTVVTNEGTAETHPIFTAYVKQPITFLDIISPDSYMRVGQPYSVDQMPVDGDQPVMQDEMGTLTGWGPGSVIDGGIIQGSFQTDGNKFTVKDFGPSYNGWAGPALKKSLPDPLQDFRVHALIDITSSANGVGRIEVYGLDTANNIVFRMSIGDFSNKTKDVKAFWELGLSTDNIFTTYGKKTGSLNDYYGSLVIERKGNRWHFYTAKRTGPTDRSGTYVDYVEKTFVDTKNQYTAPLAQIQVHIGAHLKYTPIPTMSINHVYVYDLRDHSDDEVPYIAYPGDVLQFDHKNAVIYRNGEPINHLKDFGASFFPIGKGQTELAVNPSDAAIVTVEYPPRWL